MKKPAAPGNSLFVVGLYYLQSDGVRHHHNLMNCFAPVRRPAKTTLLTVMWELKLWTSIVIPFHIASLELRLNLVVAINLYFVLVGSNGTASVSELVKSVAPLLK